jgi:hypothetical protein
MQGNKMASAEPAAISPTPVLSMARSPSLAEQAADAIVMACRQVH